MKVAALVVFLIATATSCTGSGGDCNAAPLTPVEESAAAVRATSCAPTVELEGTTYMQWGCPPVRRDLLGPIEARNGSYVARPIDGVPQATALAVRELHEPLDRRQCRGGWQFWADIDLIDRDQAAVNNLARQVNTTGKLE